MTSRERVLAALRRQEPDRVPYCELGTDRALAQKLLGWEEKVDQGVISSCPGITFARR